MKREIIGQYQYIRIVAIILVVIGHCTSLTLALQQKNIYIFGIEDLYISNLLENFRIAIYSFHMPLFVALSGAVFGLTFNNRRINKKIYIKRRAKKLLLPYFFTATFLYIPVRYIIGYYQEDSRGYIITYFQDVILGYDINYLWYLVMLFEVTSFVVLFSKFFLSNNLRIRFYVLFLCIILSTTRYILPFDRYIFQIDRSMEFLLWFYIGILLEENRYRISSLRGKKIYILLVASAVIWLCSFFLHSHLEIGLNKALYSGAALYSVKIIKAGIRLIMEGSAVLFFFMIFNHMLPICKGILKLIEKKSFDIYLYHVPIIMLYKYLILKLPIYDGMSNFMYLGLCLLDVFLSFGGAIIVSTVVQKVEDWRKNGTFVHF